jgi:hypothetical protein
VEGPTHENNKTRVSLAKVPLLTGMKSFDFKRWGDLGRPRRI